MVGTNRRSGQALIETTIFSVVFLVVIFATLAVLGTFKQELKHDFISKSQKQALDQDQLLNKYVFPFEDKNLGQIEEQLAGLGWSEESRLRIPNGLIVLFSKSDKRMALFTEKGHRFGIYY